jgi:hypothetical protein
MSTRRHSTFIPNTTEPGAPTSSFADMLANETWLLSSSDLLNGMDVVHDCVDTLPAALLDELFPSDAPDTVIDFASDTMPSALMEALL